MRVSPIFTTALTADKITPKVAAEFIARHHKYNLPRLRKLHDYYIGEHEILKRSKDKGLSNNRIVVNRCKYIADFTSSYMAGEPIKYTSKNDITPITDRLKKMKAPVQDSDLALDGAIYGTAFEMVYMSSDEKPSPKLAKLCPEETFVVYDNTVEQKSVFGVHYYAVTDNNGNVTGYEAILETAYFRQHFYLNSMLAFVSAEEPEEHFFGDVPIIEYYNDGERQGDFEQCISINDGYNTLQSDRLNDKEQFVDAILLIKGAVLGDDENEEQETYKGIKEDGILMLPEGSDASFLTRQFDETAIDLQCKSYAENMSLVSCVPDMTDENFSGNASGVALKHKLLALDRRVSVKERFFEEGLRIRLNIINNINNALGQPLVDIDDIDISFSCSLPVNELENAQIVATLNGIAPRKSLYTLLPFIADVDEAAQEMEEEESKKIQEEQKAFMNVPVNNNDEE